MKNGDEIHELNYELIRRVVGGVREALEEILRIYDSYHNFIYTHEMLDTNGRLHKVLDEDSRN